MEGRRRPPVVDALLQVRHCTARYQMSGQRIHSIVGRPSTAHEYQDEQSAKSGQRLELMADRQEDEMDKSKQLWRITMDLVQTCKNWHQISIVQGEHCYNCSYRSGYPFYGQPERNCVNYDPVAKERK